MQHMYKYINVYFETVYILNAQSNYKLHTNIYTLENLKKLLNQHFLIFFALYGNVVDIYIAHISSMFNYFINSKMLPILLYFHIYENIIGDRQFCFFLQSLYFVFSSFRFSAQSSRLVISPFPYPQIQSNAHQRNPTHLLKWDSLTPSHKVSFT